MEKTKNTMHDTILYIFGQTTSGNSVLAALEATGYDVVSTNRSTQAIALLFVMHSVAAVVLDRRTGEDRSFDLIQSLRSLCPEVPIFLLSCAPIDPLPSDVDACVTTGQPPEGLTSAVRSLLTAKRIVVDAVHCGGQCWLCYRRLLTETDL